MRFNDKLINKLEKAGGIFVIAIWFLWLWKGPVLNFSLLFSTTLLSIYYLWFGFFLFHKIQPLEILHQHIRRAITPFGIFSSILLGVLMSYGLIGILFGIFFYPGMHFMINSSGIFLIAFTIYIAIYQIRTKKNQNLCRGYYFRIIILLVFLIALRLAPVEKRLEFFYRDYPGFVDAYLEYRENPDDEQVLERLRVERSRFR